MGRHVARKMDKHNAREMERQNAGEMNRHTAGVMDRHTAGEIHLRSSGQLRLPCFLLHLNTCEVFVLSSGTAGRSFFLLPRCRGLCNWPDDSPAPSRALFWLFNDDGCWCSAVAAAALGILSSGAIGSLPPHTEKAH